jgi:hypothetical protein
MEIQYADITNKTTLLKIFQEPEFEPLQVSFFDSFLGFQLEKGSVDSLAFDNNFLAKGAFNDDLEIMGVDFSGKKILIHFRFLEMHPGLDDGYFDMPSYRWRDLKMHAQQQGFRHSNCQIIREICFFKFNISTETSYFSFREYEYEELPHTVQFDCYELPKLNSSLFKNDVSEKVIWLNVIKNGAGVLENLEETPFVNHLKKVFNINTWSEEDKKWYESRQKFKPDRIKKMIDTYKRNNYALKKELLKKPAVSVEWNWNILERQIGKLPRKQAKLTDIDIKSFEPEFLSGLAFGLFRQWTQKAKLKHPAIDFTIIDERLLIKDIEQQIRESTIALFNDDSFYERNMPKSYANMFFTGYLEGSLGKHWYMEYIIKNRDEFKTTMVLRSLSIYLELEDVTLIKIEDIYKQVMKGKINLSNPQLDITKSELKTKKGNVIEENDSSFVVQTVIQNLINEHIKKIGKIETENFNLNIDDFVSQDMINGHIEANWNLFL